jgi:hypothetical protein
VTYSEAGGYLDSLAPALASKSPEDVLKTAAQLFRTHPTASRLTFLEASANRALATAETAAEGRRIVEIASAAFREGAAKPGDRGADDSIETWLFEHDRRRGRSVWVPSWWDSYKGVRAQFLKQNSLHDSVSSLSLRCGPAPEIQGDLILFEHDRYNGRYARFSAGTSTDQEVAYIGNYMNDKTSSALIVRHWENELAPTPLGTVFDRATIGDLVLQQPRVRNLRGEPIFTWDMFPDGEDGHPNEPTSTFVYLRIPIRIDVPNWFDYDAEVRYWIRLFVDSAGRLQAQLAYYGCWVEGGVISGRVASELMARLPATIALVNGRLAGALPTINLFGPYTMAYLLPGRNDAAGHTDDDVTVVLVRGVPSSGDAPIL